MEVSRSMAKPPTHRIYYGLPLTIYPSHVRICLPYIHGSVMGNNLRRIFRCQFRKRPSLSLVWLTRNAVMKKNSRRYAEGCDYDLCEMCYKHHLEGWASAVQRRQFFFFGFSLGGGCVLVIWRCILEILLWLNGYKTIWDIIRFFCMFLVGFIDRDLIWHHTVFRCFSGN